MIVSSMIFFIWGLLPLKMQISTSDITRGELISTFINDSNSSEQSSNISIYSDTADQSSEIVAEVEISWAEMVRVGDLVEIKLIYRPTLSKLEGLDSGGIYADKKTGEEILHPQTLSARLELADVVHKPSGQISQVLSADHPVIFLWSLRPDHAGEFQGTIWLSVAFNPGDQNNLERRVLYNQTVTIFAMKLFGLNGVQSRIIGGIGIFGGLMLIFQWLFLRKTS